LASWPPLRGVSQVREFAAWLDGFANLAFGQSWNELAGRRKYVGTSSFSFSIFLSERADFRAKKSFFPG
jgi:hypothetical protein